MRGGRGGVDEGGENRNGMRDRKEEEGESGVGQKEG